MEGGKHSTLPPLETEQNVNTYHNQNNNENNYGAFPESFQDLQGWYENGTCRVEPKPTGAELGHVESGFQLRMTQVSRNRPI